MDAESRSYGLSLEPDRSSRHSLGLNASPAEVWTAITDSARLAQWFVAEARMDLTPGGPIRWVFGRGSGDPGPSPMVTEGECVGLAKQEWLRLRVGIDDLLTDLEFRIEPWRDGAILTVTHGGFPGEEEWDDTFRAIDRGWQTELHVLKIFLERARDFRRSSERHERRVDAAAEQVFDLFVTQGGLEGWLADRAAVDATPGGSFLLEWKGGETVRGHLAACDPDRFLLMTWEQALPSLVRLHLDEPEEGGEMTDLRLDHILFAPSPAESPRRDWDAALGRLQKAVRAGRTA